MKQKNLLILLVATAAAIYATTLKFGDEVEVTAADQAGEKLYADLAQRVNDVSQIEITQGTESITVQKAEDDSWRLTQMGSYPVKFETVKQYLMTFTGLERIEPKTQTASLYERIGVQDPGAESPSKLVVLKDEGGSPLASLIVGNSSDAQKPQYYVRKSGEDQSWLVAGALDIATDHTNWIDKEILNLEGPRMRQVEITRPDAEPLVIFKDAKEDANFQVQGVPEERELRFPTVANSVGSALAFLNLDDVKPQSEIDWEAGPNTTARFSAWDGLVVTAQTVTLDETMWVKFEASYSEPSEPVGPAAPEDPEAEAPAEDDGPSPAEVKLEVTKLNARLGGWAYTFPSYKNSNFNKQMDELLAEIVEEPVGNDSEVPAGEAEPNFEELMKEFQMESENLKQAPQDPPPAQAPETDGQSPSEDS